MCGGGELGGANNESNDDKKGSGNSAGESLANLFTPNDGFSYVDGVLTADRDRNTYSGTATNFNDKTRYNVSGGTGPYAAKGGTYGGTQNPNEQHKNISVRDSDGGSFFVPRNETKKYNDRMVTSAVVGALTGGLPGIAAGIGGNAVRNKLFPRDYESDRTPSIADMPRRPNTGQRGTVSDRFGNPIKGLANSARANNPELENIQRILGNANANAENNRSTSAQNRNTSAQNRNTSTGIANVGGGSVVDRFGNAVGGTTSAGGYTDPSTYVEGVHYGTTNDGGIKGLFQAGGLFAGPQFETAEERSKYMLEQKNRAIENSRSLADGSDNNDRPQQTVVDPVEKEDVPLTRTQIAEQGSFKPIPNPDYDPSDPMSPRFLINPSYEQLVEYQQQELFGGTPVPFNDSEQGQVTKMRGGGLAQFAEGGELEVAPPEGGNEKTMIVDAVRAVKGDMSEEQASIVLGQFLANYGEEALKNLVEAVQSGELDDTIERFANGEAGEVNGPGDGSGVDDKVPASLEGQQDVLLADGEFVLRKKTADALEKMYGGGFLDTINEAENDAPRAIREYMAKTA